MSEKPIPRSVVQRDEGRFNRKFHEPFVAELLVCEGGMEGGGGGGEGRSIEV